MKFRIWSIGKVVTLTCISTALVCSVLDNLKWSHIREPGLYPEQFAYAAGVEGVLAGGMLIAAILILHSFVKPSH